MHRCIGFDSYFYIKIELSNLCAASLNLGLPVLAYLHWSRRTMQKWGVCAM